MKVTITFLGAAGTVTGSKYLVEVEGPSSTRILVDAGIFQGSREWRERNWEDPPSELLRSIDAVVLTHAHIDHTGILPRYVRQGLRCPVFCTPPTRDLTELLLLDSAMLQEEEARFRAKEGLSRHNPPLPLYTRKDAAEAIKLLRPTPFGKRTEVTGGVHATWSHMGHILGAASIELEVGGKTITFSGDVGRYHVPILKDPEPVKLGDLLLIESTYGDRDHSEEGSAEHLGRIVNESVKRGGVLLIPSFAVGRTQTLLYYLRELKERNAIPDIPIIIDSPMSRNATALYAKYPSDYDEEALQLTRAGGKPFEPSKLYFIQDREESIKLNSVHEPMVIISASGMLSGGRILHHLKHRISSPQNTLLFAGFQPPGGRGAWIKSGAPTLRLLGKEVPIRAYIDEMNDLSAHGGKSELLRWCSESRALGEGTGNPSRVAVVHGEPETAAKFAATLKEKFSWDSFVAGYKQTIEV